MYFQPEDKHEARIAKREKVKKINRFKHELKITFLFNFLHFLEEVEMLEKNCGACSHTRQLKEKM